MPHDSHWQHWHEQYAEPDSALNCRLSIVRSHIERWLDTSAPAAGHRRIVSACAGDGRDVLGVLEQYRPDDVEAVLLELDPELATAARRRAADSGLDRVDVRHVDAGVAAHYAGAVPADLVLLCGIFGNVDDEDVRRTVHAVPELAAPGATVIWTRSRRAPDLTPQIRAWFAEAECDEVTFNAPSGELFSVGVHRFTGQPRTLDRDAVLFRFVTGTETSGISDGSG